MRKLWLGIVLLALTVPPAPAEGVDGIRPEAARPDTARSGAVDFRRAVIPDPVIPDPGTTEHPPEPPVPTRPTSTWSDAEPVPTPQEERDRTAGEITQPTRPRAAASDAPPGAEELSARSMYFFHDEYIAVRAGPYWGVGGKNELGTAFYGEFEFGHQFDEHAIMQFQIGMLDGDDKSNGVKTEVSSIPIMVGGTGEWAIDRAEIFVALSGGIAVTEVRTTTSGTRAKGSKNLWCGSVRVGARYWVTDDLFVGLDATYLFSTSKRFGGVNTDIDGFAALLGLGLGF